MVGKYDIEVYNNRVHYFLTAKRNITILQGNSATGKTELIRLIGEYEASGQSSGITLKCSCKCTVLTPVDWKLRLQAMKNTIVFIDETAGFLKSKEFAECVRGADNYFIIVTRDDLYQLPYSIEEIYGLRNISDSTKYKSYKRVYNEMYKLYNLTVNRRVQPNIVLTEDTGSGFQCFSTIYHEKCQPAGGKSKIYHFLRKSKDSNMLVIVDGAAFGCEIGKIMRYLRSSGSSSVIYAPESFEYLILKSGIIAVPLAILDETYLYADSKSYMSWEEFFSAYLIHVTQKTIYQYNKSELKEAFKTAGALRKIIQVLPEQIRPEE